MDKLPTLYSNYQECLLDIKIFGQIVSIPQQSLDDLRHYLFEEFKRKKPLPTLEFKRYELSRLVRPDYKIEYIRELELQDNETLVELKEHSSSRKHINFEDLAPLADSVQELFSYENGVTNNVRDEIINKYDLETGEVFKSDIQHTEAIVGSTSEDTELYLSDEDVDRLSSENSGVVSEFEPVIDDSIESVNSSEVAETVSGLEQIGNDSNEFEEVVDDFEPDDIAIDIISSSSSVEDNSGRQEFEEVVDDFEDDSGVIEGYEIVGYEDDSGVVSDFDEVVDSESYETEDDEDDSGVVLEFDEIADGDDYNIRSDDESEDDSGDESEDEFEDESEDESEDDSGVVLGFDDVIDEDDFEAESDTEFSSDDSDEDDVPDVSLGNDEDDVPDVSLGNDEDDVDDYGMSYTEDSDVDSKESSGVAQDDFSTADYFEHTDSVSISENDESSEFDDSVFVEQTNTYEEEFIPKSDKDKVVNTPVTPAQAYRYINSSEKEFVDRESEPKDIKEFLRKHPRCEYNFALKYFTKKQINDAIKRGKIIKKGNTLRV